MGAAQASRPRPRGSWAIRTLLLTLLTGAITVRAAAEPEEGNAAGTSEDSSPDDKAGIPFPDLKFKGLEHLQFKEYKFRYAGEYGADSIVHAVVTKTKRADKNKPSHPCDYYFVSDCDQMIICHNGNRHWEIHAVNVSQGGIIKLCHSSMTYFEKHADRKPEDFKSHVLNRQFGSFKIIIEDEQVCNYFKELKIRDHRLKLVRRDDEKDDAEPPKAKDRLRLEARDDTIGFHSSSSSDDEGFSLADVNEKPPARLTMQRFKSQTLSSSDEASTPSDVDGEASPRERPSAVGSSPPATPPATDVGDVTDANTHCQGLHYELCDLGDLDESDEDAPKGM